MLRKIRVAALAIGLSLVIAYVVLVAISPATQLVIPDNKLVIDGMVSNPLDLTYEELLAMPATTVTAPLICVQNQSGVGSVPS